ncbi:MAG: HIT family protein [Candidatus Nitrosopumilus sp. bin_7KS]
MDCIFCKIVSGEIKSKFLKETKHSISFLDAFPLATGHVLIIPKNHHQKIQDMSIDENTDLFTLVHQMVSNVDELTGSTLVAIHNGKDAGQEIPHVHVHLVPRSDDDSAGPIHSMFSSKVNVSESEMDELYDKLKI